MRTKLVISLIILASVAAAASVAVTFTLWWGWAGLAAFVGLAVVVVSAYVRAVRPWHSRWGATDEEVARAMPGDGLLGGAASTTRAISVDCPPDRLWPWLVQIGYGRAGWYSYDWIDNDGKPSADHIDPVLQSLIPGDTIEMMPGVGPKITEVVADHHFVAGDAEGGTWCFAIYPSDRGSRLVSRWRQNWKKDSLGAWFFITIADPGAFIMEQKMLRGIKRRAENEREPIPTTRLEVAADIGAEAACRHASRVWG